MQPNQLEMIERDGRVLHERSDEFARAFYATLFDLAPETRALFPDDLTAQRTKLVDELDELISTAVGWRTSGHLDGFVERAHSLGSRHDGYGVTASMYRPVGLALIAALRETVVDFDDDHERAWTTLYRLLADTMREGARGTTTPTPGRPPA